MERVKQYYVYMLTNISNRVLYIGVTNDMARRLDEHRRGAADGFTKRYNVHKLVYVESCGDVNAAISREKQLKGWARAKKNRLVESMHPDWRDLAKEWGWGDPSTPGLRPSAQDDK